MSPRFGDNSDIQNTEKDFEFPDSESSDLETDDDELEEMEGENEEEDALADV